MGGSGARKLLLAIAVVGALAAGGGAAYALTAPPTNKVDVAVEAPDGTQPTSDAEASASAAESSAPPSNSPQASASSTPTPSATPSATPKPSATGVAGCETGDKQQEVEGYLAQIDGYKDVTVDGQQSPQDCATIVKFQKRFGISPASGRAGPTTADVARRIAGSLTDAERAKCNPGAETVACVDLTLQTVWVVKGGVVVFGPVPARTGMSGYATPSGTYKVYDRNVKAWSTPYKVWLPYWQNFNGGMGFHATTTYLYDSFGSHGCVNLLYGDSKTLYDTIGMGTTVRVFGRRTGT